MDDEAPPPDDAPTNPDEETGTPPDLRVVRGKKGNRGRQKLTEDEYEMLVQTFLKMDRRSARQLSMLTGFSEETCSRAINRGWPVRGWPSLRERAELFDRRRRETDDDSSKKPLTAQQILDAARFLSMRNENLNMSRSFRALAMNLAAKLQAAVERATADRQGKRTRVIEEQRGKRVVHRVVQEDVTLPPALSNLASAARDLGALAMAASQNERVWAGVAVPEDVAKEKLGWDELSDEQLEYIEANGGKLPPGITAEMLYRKI